MKSTPYPLVQRIVSGGQTGVDRAALDAARASGIQHGGWCPRGRLAEDGTIPSFYELQETPSTDYAVRTEWNVRDSQGTLILHEGRLRGGTLLTRQLAKRHARPYLTIDLARVSNLDLIRGWIRQHQIETLNIAGPRESSVPGVYDRAFEFLDRLLRAPS